MHRDKSRAHEKQNPLDRGRTGAWWDWLAGVFLFAATTAVVVWQNSRLAVLWDLSYILENSYRISLGDLPYRDFVLPYAPLTFLSQAALIKLTGRYFFHHVMYCAIVGGLATVLTWRIVVHILRCAKLSSRTAAFLLSVPLVGLGIYSVFPHPFYDPDCTFAILICVFFLQRLGRADDSPVVSFVVGMLLVVPLFVKQNTGLAFLASAVVGLLVLMAVGLWRRAAVGTYLWLLAGASTAFLVALILIHATVGLANYTHWTITFAASRRLPPLKDMLAIYRSNSLLGWIAIFAGGVLLSFLNRQQNRIYSAASGLMMSAPFACASIYLLIDKDSSERAERLLNVWPLIVVVSFLFAVIRLKRQANLASILPFILIATANGAFLSQQVWGSTYALWPLFIILLAGVVAVLCEWQVQPSAWKLTTFVLVTSLSLTIAGGAYVRSHERLDYADVSDGDLSHSTLPELHGLSLRGPWIGQFEELVQYSQKAIPRNDGILMIPGEDLFYYATGRHPQFPVLMFDHTVNPYSAEEIAEIVQQRHIRWVIVKRDLQLNENPFPEKNKVLELLHQNYKRVESLDNYDIYQGL